MKQPALWLAGAFAAGILLGTQAGAPPATWVGAALLAILLGLAFVRRRRIGTAWFLAFVAWLSLGALAAALESAAVPAHHVSHLLTQPWFDSSEPLRWRGQLRSDPVRLPWGFRCEIDLDEVEIAGRSVPVAGGLRLSHFFREGEAQQVPSLRAGHRVEALARARPPRNFLNPGAFDARAHLARQDIHLTASLRSPELLRTMGDASSILSHRLARVRGHFLSRVDTLFSAAPDRAAVLRAMLLGDYNFLDREVSEAFQKTAVYHVLVISGLHVAALAAFVWWAARRMRLSLPFTVVLILLVVGSFVAVVEDRPPVERAALMAAIVLVAQLMFRRVALLNTVAVAALGVLLFRPSSLVDPSFQLSFLAATVIAGAAVPLVDATSGPYRRALQHLSDVTRDAAHAPRAAQFRLDLRSTALWISLRLPARLAPRAASLVTAPCGVTMRLWEAFVVSLTIQIAMAPMMAHYFHRVSLSGPLANIPAAMLSGLIVPFGFLALVLDAVWDWFGAVFAAVAGLLTQLLLGSVEALSTWRWAAYRVPGLPDWLLAAFYVSLALFMLLPAPRRRWKALCAAFLLALALLSSTHPFAPRLTPGTLEVTVLDVGQGDAIFIAFPDGRTLLFDGGGSYGAGRVGGVRTGLDIGEQVVSQYLWERGIKRLDAIALSHAHLDHLEGLNAVLDNFRVQELWVGRAVQSPAYRALVDHARLRGTRVVNRTRGESFQWGGVTALVLWPEEQASAEQVSNNDSLVLRLEHGTQALLLPGDIEKPVESELVARGDPLSAAMLKVPHHGSRTSTVDEFLAAIAPRFVVVSVGETNPFGHPHSLVLERLNTPVIRLFRTDLDGAVTFLSDGHTLRAWSYAQNHSLHQQKPNW